MDWLTGCYVRKWAFRKTSGERLRPVHLNHDPSDAPATARIGPLSRFVGSLANYPGLIVRPILTQKQGGCRISTHPVLFLQVILPRNGSPYQTCLTSFDLITVLLQPFVFLSLFEKLQRYGPRRRYSFATDTAALLFPVERAHRICVSITVMHSITSHSPP